MRDFIGMLTDFSLTKWLRQVHNKESNNPLNAIAHFRNGEHAVVRLSLKDAVPYPELLDIDRITFFVNPQDRRQPRPSPLGWPEVDEIELEFVRCSDD